MSDDVIGEMQATKRSLFVEAYRLCSLERAVQCLGAVNSLSLHRDEFHYLSRLRYSVKT